MGNHGRPARAAGQRDRFECLAKRPDLVQLDQDGVPRAEVDRAGDSLRIRDQQVVTDELDTRAETLGQALPAVPVVLAQAVLERDDRVALAPVGPQVDQPV